MISQSSTDAPAQGWDSSPGPHARQADTQTGRQPHLFHHYLHTSGETDASAKAKGAFTNVGISNTRWSGRTGRDPKTRLTSLGAIHGPGAEAAVLRREPEGFLWLGSRWSNTLGWSASAAPERTTTFWGAGMRTSDMSCSVLPLEDKHVEGARIATTGGLNGSYERQIYIKGFSSSSQTKDKRLGSKDPYKLIMIYCWPLDWPTAEDLSKVSWTTSDALQSEDNRPITNPTRSRDRHYLRWWTPQALRV